MAQPVSFSVASMVLPTVCPSEGLPGSAFAWRTNYPPRAQALVVTIEALMPNS